VAAPGANPAWADATDVLRYSDGRMGFALAVALTVFLGAHLSIVAGLAQRHSWRMAASALVVAPLAPWWGWSRGMHVRAMAWLVALGLYALGTVVCALVSAP
jgi:hypothetical protein